MKNFIDEAIKALEELKEKGAIVESVDINYENIRTLGDNGFYENKPTGRFFVEINGYGLIK